MVACGSKDKTTDFPQKKRKVAFPRWNILETEMLVGHKYGKKKNGEKKDFIKYKQDVSPSRA